MAGENAKQLAKKRIVEEYRERLQLFADSGSENASAELALIAEINAQLQNAMSSIDAQFPPDPPNAACRHAVITGLAITNSTWILKEELVLPAQGDFVEFFRFGRELIRIWTQETDEPSLFVVEVTPNSTHIGVWRTSAAVFSLVIELTSMQEHRSETGYSWIYNFDPARSFREQEHLEEINASLLGFRSHHSLNYWYERAHVLELLLRSEQFFVAAQLLCESFDIHWFCLECALRPVERRRHNHPEPDTWNLASLIPAMETAIVLSTRSVEALLGKPGNRDNPQKVERAKQRWRDSVLIDPDETFPYVGKSYFDYYYELFEIRAFSAHSYGTLSPDLTRANAVAAQTFANSIVHSRFERDTLAVEEAQQVLKFNPILLENINNSVFGRDYGTNRTRSKTTGRFIEAMDE